MVKTKLVQVKQLLHRLKMHFTQTLLFGCLAIIIIFAALFPLMEKYTQSFKFVDEDEHLVIGSLVNKGWRLYTDTSGNHQPLVFIGSTLIQKITHPPNTFMLIKRHREAVFAWALVWSLVLFIRFGWRSLPPIIIYESTKYLLLGGHFLGESLAVYPFLFVIGSLYDQLENNSKVETSDNLLFGIAATITPLLLLPLIVPVSLVIITRLLKFPKDQWWQIVVGSLLILVPLFSTISVRSYVEETIINNTLYAVPAIAEAKTLTDKLALLSLPITTWMSPRNLLNNWITLISFIWIVGLLVAALQKKFKLMFSLLLIFFIWNTTNSRNLEPGKYFYQGFHLSPWFASGLFVSAFLVKDIKDMVGGKVKLIAVGAILVAASILYLDRSSPIFAKIDPQTENYIQHSPMATIGQIIKIFSSPGDHLLSLPNETLVYWDTNLEPAMKQVGFNDWQYSIPRKRIEYFDMITNQPPEFIVFRNEGSRYTPNIEVLVRNSYTLIFQIHQGSAGVNRLYIRNDKAASIPTEKWQEVASLPITIEPTILEYAN